MKREKSWRILTAALMLGVLCTTGCGKKTVDPSGSEETQETETVDESETRGQSETDAETETARDQLAGGSTENITYEVQYVNRRYEADDGTPIFELKLARPMLMGEGEGIEKINTFFEKWSQKKLEEYEADENSTRQSALEVYRESRDAGWAGPWGEEYRVSAVKAHSGYVSILMDSYLYEGGAHGMPYREGHVFRLMDGQEVALTDLSGKKQEEWDKLLRARFSKLVSEGEEAQYYEDALELLKERDMKDTGYYFTDTGIIFYLPPYEIAPYSTGYVEIEIPFEEAGIKQQ